MVLSYLMNKDNFIHVKEKELRWKKYKSEYNHNYYYNCNENVLVLEETHEDENYSEYFLINYKWERYLWEWDIWCFEEEGNEFEIYNTDLWR